MEDSQLFISKKIYDFQIEMIYWDRYISGLTDFILYEKLTNANKYKLQNEITKIEFYKYKREVEFKEYLTTHKFSTESKNKLKPFYNDTNIETNTNK
jgi:hypothetical protein